MLDDNSLCCNGEESGTFFIHVIIFDLLWQCQGTLENGRMFDSSLGKGREPIEFELGKGKVIKGKLLKNEAILDHKPLHMGPIMHAFSHPYYRTVWLHNALVPFFYFLSPTWKCRKTRNVTLISHPPFLTPSLPSPRSQLVHPYYHYHLIS